LFIGGLECGFVGNARKPTDPYPCDLTLSKQDLHTIKKTNWIDGFLWGAFLTGVSTMLLCLFVSVVF